MALEDIVREPVEGGHPYAGTSCKTGQISSHTVTFGSREMIEPCRREYVLSRPGWPEQGMSWHNLRRSSWRSGPAGIHNLWRPSVRKYVQPLFQRVPKVGVFQLTVGRRARVTFWVASHLIIPFVSNSRQRISHVFFPWTMNNFNIRIRWEFYPTSLSRRQVFLRIRDQLEMVEQVESPYSKCMNCCEAPAALCY